MISGSFGAPAVVRAVQAFCYIAGNSGVVAAVGAPKAEDVEHVGIVGKELPPPLPDESLFNASAQMGSLWTDPGWPK